MFARPSAIATACLLALSLGAAHAKPVAKAAVKSASKPSAAKVAKNAAPAVAAPSGKAKKRMTGGSRAQAKRSAKGGTAKVGSVAAVAGAAAGATVAAPSASPASAAIAKSPAGKTAAKHADPALFADITQLVPTSRLGSIENSIMGMEPAVRTYALRMMMRISLLAPSMLVEDANGDGRGAASYGSGVALERLQRLATRAELPGTAMCLEQFASTLKEGKKPLLLQFPDGCAGLKELHAVPAQKNVKLEGVALQWAASAVRDGLAQARKEGLTYKARPSTVSLAAAFK